MQATEMVQLLTHLKDHRKTLKNYAKSIAEAGLEKTRNIIVSLDIPDSDKNYLLRNVERMARSRIRKKGFLSREATMSTEELRKKIADSVRILRRIHGPREVRLGKNIRIESGKPVSVRLTLLKSIQHKRDGSMSLLWNDPMGNTHNFPIV